MPHQTKRQKPKLKPKSKLDNMQVRLYTVKVGEQFCLRN